MINFMKKHKINKKYKNKQLETSQEEVKQPEFIPSDDVMKLSKKFIKKYKKALEALKDS